MGSKMEYLTHTQGNIYTVSSTGRNTLNEGTKCYTYGLHTQNLHGLFSRVVASHEGILIGKTRGACAITYNLYSNLNTSEWNTISKTLCIVDEFEIRSDQ